MSENPSLTIRRIDREEDRLLQEAAHLFASTITGDEELPEIIATLRSSDRECLGAFEGGALVGAAALRNPDQDSRVATLSFLAVASAHRGRRIGVALLHAAEQLATAQGASELYLEALPSMDQEGPSEAQRFFVHHGYQNLNPEHPEDYHLLLPRRKV